MESRRKISLYWLFTLLIMVSVARAQDTMRDSLEDLLAGELADTTRVNVLLKTAGILGEEEGEKIDSLYRSALTITDQIEQRESRARALDFIGQYFMASRRYDSAVHYLDKVRDLSEELRDVQALANVHSSLGNAYYFQANYNQTLYHFLERLEYCEQLADSSCISAASNNAGLVLINLGRYEDAIDYTLRSLRIDEARGYPPGILSSQMSLGNINYYLENYNRAIEYYLDIVATCESIGNEELRISYAYNNIASIYFQQEEFENAAEYYERSLVLEQEFGNDNGVALKYNNLGSVYQELGDLDAAEDYFRQALSMRQDLGDQYGISSTENNLGGLNLKRGRPAMALQFYRSALGHAQQAGSLEASKNAHEGLAKAYRRQGQYALALENYEQFLQLNDSILDAEKAKTIAELEARYESEKKEGEIALLRKNKELQEARLTQQEASLRAGKLQRNVLIAGLIALLIIGSLMFYSYNQRLAAKELIQRNQKETEAMRSRFFASISHEFRTPLTLISSPVTQLQKKYEKEQETNGLLRFIYQNAQKLQRLINQILDLSKLEVGRLQLYVEEGDIISWLRIIAASFTSLAEEKDIAYRLNLPENPIPCYFDREKLEQMVSNLLSNAMKFTLEGGAVEVEVMQEGHFLSIRVKNSGSPISEADQKLIFDRFYQTDAQHQAQGTGIGLALVKELAELHHGEITVQSKADQTAFTLKIPLLESAYADDLKLRTDAKLDTLSEKAMKGNLGEPAESAINEDLPVVLLVEDNDDLRRYMRSQLQENYLVREAKNGRQALEEAVAQIPDLVITDLMMPELNGEALLEALRKDPKTQHIPVIMLTARTERESRLNTLGKGADHYLTKPFDVEELRVRIKSLLEQRIRIRRHHQSEFLTNPRAEAITSSEDRFLQQVGHIVAENLDNADFSVDSFADKMGMSRVQLYRKMKAIIGYSASDFIRQYRLKKAYEYLENHKGTVSEIAYDVGFNNLSYFTRAFKEVYNRTPSEVLQNPESSD